MDVCSLSALELARGAHAARSCPPSRRSSGARPRGPRSQPALNPFAVRLDERARRAAAAADAALARGEGGPLCGIPLTIKDSHWLAGVTSAVGSRASPIRPVETSAAVERLEAAGAVIYAKTTTPEFCYFGITESPLNGRTSNPWDLTRTPGGSSGGAAAALAAGAGPLALGGDGGGSIRIPAAFCGLVGFKPTFGLVPREPCSPGLEVSGQLRADGAHRGGRAGDAARDRRDGTRATGTASTSTAWTRPRRIPPSCGSWSPRTSGSPRSTTTSGGVPGHGRPAGGGRRDARRGLARPGLVGPSLVGDRRRRRAFATPSRRAASSSAPHARRFMGYGEHVTTGEYVQAQVHARADPPRVRRPVRAHRRVGAAHAHARRARRSSTAPRIRPRSAASPIDPPWHDWGGFLYDANLAGLPACAVPVGLGDERLPVSVQLLGHARARRRGAGGRRGRRAAGRASTSAPACRTPHHPPTRRASAVTTIETTQAPLDGVSEIRGFLRTNDTPVFFVSPTGVQPAGHRPLGAELLLRHLLRLVRGRAPARVRAVQPRAAATSRRSRTSATTCCATPRCARGSPRTGPAARSRS